MVKRTFAIALCLLGLMTPVFADPPADGSNWQQTFNDDFNGTTLNTTNWAYCYPWGCGPNAANGELQGYTKNAISVANGFLSITAQKKSINVDGYNYAYQSGMITTHGKFSQVGGYVESRIKFPAGTGLWGAMWQQKEFSTGSQEWPPENDIVEYIGNPEDVQIVNVNRHYDCSQGSSWAACNDGQPVKTGTNLSLEYHIFGADIQPDKNKIDYYLDNKKIWTITGNISNAALYNLLNLAVGGTWPGNPNSSTKFPAVMSVDYYRIWKRGTGTTTPTPTPNPNPTPSTSPISCTGTASLTAPFTLNCVLK